MLHRGSPVNDAPHPPGAAGIHALHKVHHDQSEAARHRLQERLEQAARSDGFILATAIKLTLADGDYLASHIAFASAPHRDAWRAEAAQGDVLGERITDGPVAWIDFTGIGPAIAKPAPPPKWKMAILSWLTIFPTLTTFLILTSPYLHSLHLVGRIFINTVLIAPLMTWVLMPTMTRIFRRWLHASR